MLDRLACLRYTSVMDIDISGLNKTDVLIALYASAKPQGSTM